MIINKIENDNRVNNVVNNKGVIRQAWKGAGGVRRGLRARSSGLHPLLSQIASPRPKME